METVTLPAIILDHGSGRVKAGFSGDHLPQSVFRTLDIASALGKDAPISDGIMDWDAIENIWKRIFKNELRVEPCERFILLTESPVNSEANREKMAEILFERFGFQKIASVNKAILSLSHSGRTSGVVVQCGHLNTNVVPIYQSAAVRNSTVGFDIAGHHLTNTLGKLLSERGYEFKIPVQYDYNELVKEKLCYVSTNFEGEMKSENLQEQKRTQRVPDGQFLTIDKERFMGPEIFFRPFHLGSGEVSIQELTNKTILKTDPKLHSLFYANVVVSGGTALLPGFCERLELELRKLAPETVRKVRVSAPDNAGNASWIGGSILTSIPSFQNLWVTRDDYHEIGARVVHSV